MYMYQRSSSSTAESMTSANKSVRDRTAIDPINTLILLLKLEAKRYADNKEKAWEWTEVLTPPGQKLLTAYQLWTLMSIHYLLSFVVL
jgi:hypothetical protein